MPGYVCEADVTPLFTGKIHIANGDAIQIGTIPPGATLISVQHPYSNLTDRRVYVGYSYCLPDLVQPSISIGCGDPVAYEPTGIIEVSLPASGGL